MGKVNMGVIVLMFASVLTLNIRCGTGGALGFVESNVVQGKVKVTQLHLFVQDIAGGADPTVYEVARASITANSTSRFGQVKVMDHRVTAEASQESAEVGRVQGLITSADLGVMGFATNLNFLFTFGEYNGSTISILGRNEIGAASRELPVVGGTGLFRFSSGYAICTTYSYNAATSHTVLEYKLYVTSLAQAWKTDAQDLL